MHAAVHAGIGDLVEGLREASVGAYWVCQTRYIAVYGEGKVVRAEEEFQRLGRSAAEAAVRRRVLRVIRRSHLRDPVGVRRGLGVAVGVARADRGHRAPEVVGELGIPAGDYRVRRRRGEHCEEPGVVL